MKIAALVIASALLATSAVAQDLVIPTYGPDGTVTGTSAVAVPPAEVGAQIASREGTITVNVTITIKSDIPTSEKVYCYTTFSHSGSTSYYEASTVTATRSGRRATCKVVTPYLWPEANETGQVFGSLNVYSGRRSHSRGLTSFAVPRNGGTKTISARAVL